MKVDDCRNTLWHNRRTKKKSEIHWCSLGRNWFGSIHIIVLISVHFRFDLNPENLLYILGNGTVSFKPGCFVWVAPLKCLFFISRVTSSTVRTSWFTNELSVLLVANDFCSTIPSEVIIMKQLPSLSERNDPCGSRGFRAPIMDKHYWGMP